MVPAAAILVHQLRYWLAYGPRANAELAAQGHSYLHSLVPWAIFALAAGGGLFLCRVVAALRGGRDVGGGRASALAVWLACWLALLAVYATQETLEAFLATGHPTGLGGVLGHGGWWAVPVAAVVAAVLTALLLFGRVLLRYAATVPRSSGRLPLRILVPAGLRTAVARPLEHAAAGRAPPARLRLR
jgi:hypothetical protein